MPSLLRGLFVAAKITNQKGMCHALNIGGRRAPCQVRGACFRLRNLLASHCRAAPVSARPAIACHCRFSGVMLPVEGGRAGSSQSAKRAKKIRGDGRAPGAADAVRVRPGEHAFCSRCAGLLQNRVLPPTSSPGYRFSNGQERLRYHAQHRAHQFVHARVRSGAGGHCQLGIIGFGRAGCAAHTFRCK
jgi:hypothetical protein